MRFVHTHVDECQSEGPELHIFFVGVESAVVHDQIVLLLRGGSCSVMSAT